MRPARGRVVAAALVAALASCAASPPPPRSEGPRVVVETVERGSADSARAMSRRLGARAAECGPGTGGIVRVRIDRERGAPRMTVVADAPIEPATYRCMVAALEAPDPAMDAVGEEQPLTVVLLVEW